MCSAKSNNLSADPRSINELFAASLTGDYDDQAAWDAVGVLRMKGTPEVFELAKTNVASESPKARARALDVLGQLGAGNPDGERPFKNESIAIAIQMTRDADPLVASQAAWALAHLGGPEARGTLIAMREDTDSDIRQAVAVGLHGAGDQVAIATLIQLMEDDDDEVRNWATFALGSIPQNDSAEIRHALRARLQDPCLEARDEALWGLVLRQERVAIELLLRRFDSDEFVSGDVQAAQEVLDLLGDAPPLEQLKAGLRDLLSK